MRIDEIVINVPIKIDLGGGEPQVNVAGQSVDDNSALDQNPVMVSPQQQELELKKAELGKSTPVMDKLLHNNDIGDEVVDEVDNNYDDDINNLRALAGLRR